MKDEPNAIPEDPAALRALVEELRQRLAERDTQLVERDAHLAKSDAQIAERDTQIAERDTQIAERDSRIAEKEAQIHELQESLLVAKERAQWFQRRMFGRSSEKIPPADIEKLLFELAEIFGWETAEGVQGGVVPPGDEENEENQEEADRSESEERCNHEEAASDSKKSGVRIVTVQSHQRKVRTGHGRRKIPEGLPRVVLGHDLAEQDRLCENCGDPKDQIGVVETKLFEFLLPLVYMLVHARSKYACRKKACEGKSKPVVAPMPRLPIHKGKAGPGMLAQILIGKFLDHLPLYRQQSIFLRHGIEIARSTMGDWVARCSELLSALAERLRREVLASDLLQTDDTPLPVLPEPIPGGGKKQGLPPRPVKKGHLWVYRGDEDHPYVVFDFSENWSARDGPEKFLEGFSGSYMQADAYKGYDAFFARGPTREVGCWAHARRKVHEAYQSSQARAKIPLTLIQGLYRIEREAKNQGLDPEARRALRQEHAKPLVENLRKWLDEVGSTMSPKSLMGKAVTYLDNQWQALGRYLEDGRLEIDNNASERELRPIGTGRRSWVFAGSDDAAHRAADVYTVISSAKRCGIEPHAYLRHLLTVLPYLPGEGSDREAFLTELLPDRWQKEESDEDRFLSHLGPDVVTSFLQSLVAPARAAVGPK